jgi:1-acyl-sn-glycerol-3-phosphate acyltransferase
MTNYLFCNLVHLLGKCGVLKLSTAQGISILSTQLWWKIALGSGFWVRRVNATPGAWKPLIADLSANEAAVKAGGKRRPIYILSNHCSFLDAMLLVVHFPSTVLWRTRVFFSSHVMKAPFFGTIVRSQGHFPVWFKSDANGKFSVDKDKMAKVEEEVLAHGRGGGVLSLFPEGNINRTGDTSVLQTFRHGTFKRALEEDAVIWFFVMHGNENAWPASKGFALEPARIGYGLYSVFEPGQGAKSSVEAIKAAALEAGKLGGGALSCETGSEDEAVILAEHCRAVMTERKRELAEATCANRGCCGGCCFTNCGTKKPQAGSVANEPALKGVG